jgi:TPR repeat protein
VLSVFGAPVQADEQIPGLGLSSPREMARPFAGGPVKRILAGVVVAAMLSGSALAGPSEEGWATYQGADYETALRLWRPLAEQGNAFSQSILGFMYDSGQGVPRDLGEALAAEQGNPRAQSNLGSVRPEKA